MQVAFFSTYPYERASFESNQSSHRFTFVAEKLDLHTADTARGHRALCLSVNDVVDESLIRKLSGWQIDLIIVRGSGADNIDLQAAAKCGITVKWLPGYAPRAIAEHAVALLLGLNRKIHLASARVRQGDFSIEGLGGTTLYHKTVGIVGLGRIGSAFARIMSGFGCYILATDLKQNAGALYDDMQLLSFSDLLRHADVISLHCSLNEATARVINAGSLRNVRPGALLINTARGKLVDTRAVLEALDEGLLGGYAADVYEHEEAFFHHTFPSLDAVEDPLLRMLATHPRVLLTAHQAFFTTEAMQQIARTVVNELTYYESLTGGEADRLIV